MATQNPKGSAGTQLLPESQLDRFMICMSMGYPDMESELAIAKGKSIKSEIASVRTLLDAENLLKLQAFVETIHIHDKVYTYICKLVQSTREHAYIELGISPRGTIACVRMVKAWAFLQGREYVTPEDVADIFLDIGKHRIILNTKARVSHVTQEAVLKEVLKVMHRKGARIKCKAVLNRQGSLQSLINPSECRM